MNCAFALAFGAPVARFLGTGARGALTFLVFFVLCGVLAGLACSIATVPGLPPAVCKPSPGQPSDCRRSSGTHRPK